jgi:hypothetical protein
MLFFVYIIFFIPDHFTDMCLLCADVGPVRPTNYVRNMRRPQPGVASAAAGGPVAI